MRTLFLLLTAMLIGVGTLHAQEVTPEAALEAAPEAAPDPTVSGIILPRATITLTPTPSRTPTISPAVRPDQDAYPMSGAINRDMDTAREIWAFFAPLSR